MPDAEIEAMGKVAEALGELEEDAQGRVLRWAAERYGVALAPARDKGGKGGGGRVDPDEGYDEDGDEDQNGGSGGNGIGNAKEFEHFAELYDATDPITDAEKALVASYWVQFIKGKASFGSRELNMELKDLGHAASAINKSMSQNMKKKPALILQVSRGGGSPQAQKKYKVSEAGKKWVEARL
jgi:hypothetical protein